MEVSIKLEATSLLIVAIIALFHYDRKNKYVKRYQLYNVCLIFTTATIITDILACVMIENVSIYPLWLHMAVNSLYFVCINSCLSMVAAYVFYLLFEYMDDRHCYRMAVTLVGSMWAALIILIVINIPTGCYFYFENNTYCRGPLNKVGFFVMIIEVGMLCMCYVRNRKVLSPYASNLVKAIPPVAVLLTIVQLVLPNTILTGTIATLVDLILFATFQTNRIGRDALTELQNRSAFFGELSHYKEKRNSAHVVLVHLIRLDKVNKRFGMKDGDALLYLVARYLENLVPDYRVYRYGNTHFTMLGNFESPQKAEELVEKILERFEQPWKLNGNEWLQNIQLVHMELGPDQIDENHQVEQLNYMLSYRKSEEESTRLFFDDELKARYERKNYVLNEVRKAIRDESFVLYFQPVYSCREDKFLTAEVLLRLFLEDGTSIPPGEFIPIAEEYNLSDEISWFVLKKSMQFVREHPKFPLDSISINMSLQQMRPAYINEKVEYVRQMYGSMLDKIRIEITENIIARNPEMAKRIMKSFAEQGMGFYLDDFGVGYSNFSRVFEFPFEVIKFDRSLMERIDQNEKIYQILKSLVETFHNAGFKVIAEGLETESQVERAKAIGVDKIQGYYYAKAMGEKSLIEFLKQKNGDTTNIAPKTDCSQGQQN